MVLVPVKLRISSQVISHSRQGLGTWPGSHTPPPPPRYSRIPWRQLVRRGLPALGCYQQFGARPLPLCPVSSFFVSASFTTAFFSYLLHPHRAVFRPTESLCSLSHSFSPGTTRRIAFFFEFARLRILQFANILLAGLLRCVLYPIPIASNKADPEPTAAWLSGSNHSLCIKACVIQESAMLALSVVICRHDLTVNATHENHKLTVAPTSR